MNWGRGRELGRVGRGVGGQGEGPHSPTRNAFGVNGRKAVGSAEVGGEWRMRLSRGFYKFFMDA